MVDSEVVWIKFATTSLQALIGNSICYASHPTIEGLASEAADYADAMLCEYNNRFVEPEGIENNEQTDLRA